MEQLLRRSGGVAEAADPHTEAADPHTEAADPHTEAAVDTRPEAIGPVEAEPVTDDPTPTDTEPWSDPLALLALGEVDLAVDAARDAVTDDPATWQPHRLLAEVLVRRGARGDLAEAYRAAREACRLSPDVAAAHTTYGLVRSLAGDQAGARRAYQEALELEPDHAAALHNIGLQQLARGQLFSAARTLRRAWPGPEADPTYRAVLARLVAVALYGATVVGAALDLAVLVVTAARPAAAPWAGLGALSAAIAGGALLGVRLRAAEPRLLMLAGGTGTRRVTQLAASVVAGTEAAILVLFAVRPGLLAGAAAALLLVPICVVAQALVVGLIAAVGRGRRLVRRWWLHRTVPADA
jgi:tetratricopeptide (TPR) repeat protein